MPDCSISAQRNALSITANCCQNLLPEEFVYVTDALAILSGRLVHEDKKTSELACLALSRLAESYKNDRVRLRDIAKPEVLSNLQQILITNPPTVSSNTFVTVLHVLVIIASHGSDVGPALLKNKMGETIRQLLVKQKPSPLLMSFASNQDMTAAPDGKGAASAPFAIGPSTSSTAGEKPKDEVGGGSGRGSSGSGGAGKTNSPKFIELVQRNPQELYEITSFVAELMPPLPSDGIFAVDALLVRPGAYVRDPVLWQWQDDKGNWHTYGYNDCRLIILQMRSNWHVLQGKVGVNVENDVEELASQYIATSR